MSRLVYKDILSAGHSWIKKYKPARIPCALGVGSGLFLVLAVLLVGLIVLVLMRVYVFSCTDRFTALSARMLFLPAERVGDSMVGYGDFADLVRVYEVAGNNIDSQWRAQLRRHVLQQLAEDIIIKKMAPNYQVKFFTEEVDGALARALSTLGPDGAIIKKQYGLSLKRYRQLVVAPLLLRNKLEAVISGNTTTRVQVYERAIEVLDKIKNGEDFGAVAKKYSEDNYQSQGGDLGWVERGRMVPPVEEVIFSSHPGQVYPLPIESMFGYHIIKVTDVKWTVSESTSLTPVINSAHVSQILLRFPSLNKILSSQRVQTVVKIYLRNEK